MRINLDGKFFQNSIHSEKGSIALLILTSLSMILAGAIIFSSHLINQYKSLKITDKKIDISDLETLIVLSLSESAVCECHLTPNQSVSSLFTTQPFFNSTKANSTISIPFIRYNCDAPNLANQDPLIESGKQLFFSKNGLKVNAISLSEIQKSTEGPDIFLANLKVEWEKEPENLNLSALKIPMKFKADISQTSKAFVKRCLSLGGTQMKLNPCNAFLEMSAFLF